MRFGNVLAKCTTDESIWEKFLYSLLMKKLWKKTDFYSQGNQSNQNLFLLMTDSFTFPLNYESTNAALAN